MKKSNLVIGVVSILIILASLAFMLCDIFIPIYLWYHPVLNFLAFILIGFGLLCIVLGVIKKSTFYYFLSVLFLTPAIFYILIQYIKWWIVLIILICLCSVLAILGVILFGNKSESIALNELPDYKNYKERYAEKQANATQEELPKIKSFKD